MSARLMRRVAVLGLSVAAGVTLTGAPSVTAAPLAATNGVIGYYVQGGGTIPNGTIHAVNADGTNDRVLTDQAGSAPAWAPDGSRFAYTSHNAAGQIVLKSKRANGSGEVQLTDPATSLVPMEPAWSPDGSFLIYSASGVLKGVTADGKEFGQVVAPGPGMDDDPTIAPDGSIVFTRHASAGTVGSLFRAIPGGAPVQLVADGFAASFSPDGSKLAYTHLDPAGDFYQIWISDADGANPVQLTTDNESSERPSWSGDGSSVLFVRLDGISMINLSTKVVTSIGRQTFAAAWQPVRRNTVARVWGQDHIDTAVATSQFNYATAGTRDGRAPAGGVVLSRDDTFFDALVGSAYAIKQHAPLLVTNRAALDSRVERELQRVLAPGGTVTLLGGELALSKAVADRVTALGYTVDRIFGQTHFDTALAIDKRLAANPRTAIVSTGVNFFDALAAGAAAGANPGTVIVLTNGDSMPAQSAAYLNQLNPDPDNGTAIVTGGGPGDRALLGAFHGGQLPSWPAKISYFPLVGPNEKDTALLLADFFFAAPAVSAVATNRTWFDALTGGAMVGFDAGPLLITDPATLYPGVSSYLSRNSGNIFTTVMLGGPVALSDALKSPLGEAISLPGQWDFVSLTPGAAPVRVAQRSPGTGSVATPGRNRAPSTTGR